MQSIVGIDMVYEYIEDCDIWMAGCWGKAGDYLL